MPFAWVLESRSTALGLPSSPLHVVLACLVLYMLALVHWNDTAVLTVVSVLQCLKVPVCAVCGVILDILVGQVRNARSSVDIAGSSELASILAETVFVQMIGRRQPDGCGQRVNFDFIQLPSSTQRQ